VWELTIGTVHKCYLQGLIAVSSSSTPLLSTTHAPDSPNTNATSRIALNLLRYVGRSLSRQVQGKHLVIF
jgi:hypothetical protein